MPGCTQTVMPQNSTTANVLPTTEEEQSAFFEQLKIAQQTQLSSHWLNAHPTYIHQSRRLDVFHLHSPFSMIINNKGIEQNQLYSACQSAFEAITITTEEAIYLEQSTRLQAQWGVWFEHRKGWLTASTSKFGQIICTNPTCPFLSILKYVMQHSQSLQVPSLKWGVDQEVTDWEQYTLNCYNSN